MARYNVVDKDIIPAFLKMADISKEITALDFFSEKYQTETDAGVFELIAKTYLEANGFSGIDAKHLSAKQEELLLALFHSLSKEDVTDWLWGILQKKQEVFKKG